MSHSDSRFSRCKFLSEPDMNADYQDDLDDEDNRDHHDEDYLFEFDIGSPTTSEDDNLPEFDKNILNVIEDEEEEVILKRNFSTSSDSESISNSSNSSHRKESGVVADGFSSIFGSTSSGVGSDRRTWPHTDDESLELEGISVKPEEWAENSARYLGGKLSAALGLGPRSSEGSASSTPILAASPQVKIKYSPPR